MIQVDDLIKVEMEINRNRQSLSSEEVMVAISITINHWLNHDRLIDGSKNKDNIIKTQLMK